MTEHAIDISEQVIIDLMTGELEASCFADALREVGHHELADRMDDLIKEAIPAICSTATDAGLDVKHIRTVWEHEMGFSEPIAPTVSDAERAERLHVAISDYVVADKTLETFWVVFSDPTKPRAEQFLGVAIFDLLACGDGTADTVAATMYAHELGINPGGAVIVQQLDANSAAKIPNQHKNKLITDEQLLMQLGSSGRRNAA